MQYRRGQEIEVDRGGSAPDEQVEVAVKVVIRPGGGIRVETGGGADAGRGRDVGEGPVTMTAIQPLKGFVTLQTATITCGDGTLYRAARSVRNLKFPSLVEYRGEGAEKTLAGT